MRHPAIPPHGPRRTVNGRHGVKLFFRRKPGLGLIITGHIHIPGSAAGFHRFAPCGRPVGRAANAASGPGPKCTSVVAS